MSTQSVRRLKERGGSGGKIVPLLPTKTLAPISEKPNSVLTGRKSLGKENPYPRSVLGPTQKPVIQPMVRTRSQSQPRGSSSSGISDFSKVLSEMRKVKGLSEARVLERKGFRDSNPKIRERKGCDSGRKVSDECEQKVGLSANSGKRSVSVGKFGLERCRSDKGGSFSLVDNGGARTVEKLDVKVMKASDEYDQKVNLSANSGKRSVSVGKFGLERCRSDKGGSFSLVDNGRTRKGEKLEVKVVSNEGSSGRVVSKSASRLHEKLAYLEGKVKRIAGDIKKTKEMLDMNNTDASKVILSDIQEKISGIEKAVGNVIADSNSHVTGGFSDENSKIELKVSGKESRSQELEARLFPHQKLLRNRTLSNVSVVNKVSESNCIEDNTIAQQFLASLDKGIIDEVRETEEPQTSTAERNSGTFSGIEIGEIDLLTSEKLDEFDDHENKTGLNVEDEMEENSVSELIEVGRKNSTGGWFVSEGEAVLLAHDDGSCSFHDIVNSEEKAEYKPPPGLSQNIWRDCWIMRAPGADGCSSKYIIAASAGNTIDAGFCSWDFYSKDIRAFHIEDDKTSARVALSPLPDNIMHRRNPLSGLLLNETRQWWYRPCGPLIISTASAQRGVKVFDIRDGEQVMRWDVEKNVLGMDYSSPLQWRNRGKVVVAEVDGLSVWDVGSLHSQALSNVSASGRRISALHVNNTDGELGGGVRQRVSSSEAEGNDGVFCTNDAINVLDFRQPSGIAMKISKIGVNIESVSCKGDSIFLGANNVISAAKKQVNSQILQFSLRKQKIVTTYNLPESSAHSHHRALTQVWGNSDLVMAASGLGLFVFDTQKDDELPSFVSNYNSPQNIREVIGPDDMYSPSFDYHSSQILLISRDRPAMWRQISQR